MISQLDLLRLGADQESMATLRALGFDCPPTTRYQPYARLLDEPSGVGKRIRRGFARAWWTFAILEVPLYEGFKNILNGKEVATAYITTLEDTEMTSEETVGTYTDFSVLMRIAEKTWATNERWEDVVVEFTRLQEA